MSIQTEIINRLKKKGKKTLMDFINELQQVQQEHNKSVINALKCKDLIKTNSALYAEQLFKLLGEQAVLAGTLAITLNKCIGYLVTLDVKRMAESKDPVGMDLLMSEVTLKKENDK